MIGRKSAAICASVRVKMSAPITALSLLAGLSCVAGCAKEPPRESTVGVGPTPTHDAATAKDGSTEDLDANSILRGSILPVAEGEVRVPYRETGQWLLESSAVLGRLDVLFSVDTTSSMSEEIDLLQESLLARIIPALDKQVPDVAIGVSRFEDFPIAPFGNSGSGGQRADQPFFLLTAITQDEEAVQRALSSLDDPLGLGGDGPEAGAEALFQVATGSGFRAHNRQYVLPFAPELTALGSLGGVGFRELSLPLVVHMTDSRSHDLAEYGSALPNVHSVDQAIAALSAIDARVIGVATAPAALDELTALAIGTRAVLPPDSRGQCATGLHGTEVNATSGTCPLVFETDSRGSGLSDGIVDSIVALLDGLRFSEVRAVVAADPVGFVHDISLRTLKQPDGASGPKTADLRPLGAPDGVDDTFVDVHNRARMGFLINFKNDLVLPMAEPQSFRVLVQILGDGWVLEEHLLRVVVPADALDAGAPASDASNDAQQPDSGA